MSITHYLNRAISVALSTLTLCILCSCAASSPLTRLEPGTQVQVEIYLSRTSVVDTEFEQYKISGPRLFRECGSIRHGRHISNTQGLDSLETQVLEDIKLAAMELAISFPETRELFDVPGKNTNFTDPGQLYINIEANGSPIQIKTSLDSVAQASNKGESRILKLVSLVRHASLHTECGKKGFFGLPGVKDDSQ